MCSTVAHVFDNLVTSQVSFPIVSWVNSVLRQFLPNGSSSTSFSLEIRRKQEEKGKVLEVLSFCPVIVSNQRPKFSVPCCLLVHEVWRRRPKERTLLRHLTACFSGPPVTLKDESHDGTVLNHMLFPLVKEVSDVNRSCFLLPPAAVCFIFYFFGEAAE